MIMSSAEPDEPFKYKHVHMIKILEDKTTTVIVTLLKNNNSNTDVTL